MSLDISMDVGFMTLFLTHGPNLPLQQDLSEDTTVATNVQASIPKVSLNSCRITARLCVECNEYTLVRSLLLIISSPVISGNVLRFNFPPQLAEQIPCEGSLVNVRHYPLLDHVCSIQSRRFVPPTTQPPTGPRNTKQSPVMAPKVSFKRHLSHNDGLV